MEDVVGREFVVVKVIVKFESSLGFLLLWVSFLLCRVDAILV